MGRDIFSFKQFTINQENSGMKVGTDGVLLGAWANVEYADNILDIGTGTGLIALMIAQRSNAKITAIEPHKGSFEDAINNINSSIWKERILVINSTLQDFHVNNASKYDHIISNPPYFINSLLPNNKGRAIARHSNNLSLQELIRISANLLAISGKISIIIPVESEDSVSDEATINKLYLSRKLYIKPTLDKAQIRVLLEFTDTEKELQTDSICIEKGGRHNYSKEYINLTKDFYLKM